MHANRLMPNVYRKKLLAFTINSIFKDDISKIKEHILKKTKYLSSE